MGLRVAIDLDGTVADLSRAMHDVARKKFRKLQDAEPADAGPAAPDGAVLPERPRLSGLGLTPYELERLWTHVLKIRNFWTTLPETDDGVVSHIQQLADERRWDVLFITTRPTAAGRPTQVQSQEWLSQRRASSPECLRGERDPRGRVAAALDLDAVIDDRPENCLDGGHRIGSEGDSGLAEDLDRLGPGVQGHRVVVKASCRTLSTRSSTWIARSRAGSFAA
ncbi:MAG: hypothetical protein R2708_03420 [Vicinamibacterales bacterium]